MSDNMYTKRWEFQPMATQYSQREALGLAIEHAEAAGKLGLPFTLSHVAYKSYRHGGNIHKAHCEAYELTIYESIPSGDG